MLCFLLPQNYIFVFTFINIIKVNWGLGYRNLNFLFISFFLFSFSFIYLSSIHRKFIWYFLTLVTWFEIFLLKRHFLTVKEFPYKNIFWMRTDTFMLFSSLQSLSRVRLYDPMTRSTPGLPVYHQLLKFTRIYVHGVSDVIQPSHPLSPSAPAPNPSQYQGIFQ